MRFPVTGLQLTRTGFRGVRGDALMAVSSSQKRSGRHDSHVVPLRSSQDLEAVSTGNDHSNW